MYFRMVTLFLSFLIVGMAQAKDKFTCDGSEVTIEVVKNSENMYAVDSVVKVTRNEAVTILRFQNIDFIGGTCAKNSLGFSEIVFKAGCGGSGCKDLDNWGIIDPKTLQVLLVPNDTNREEAKKILGTELPDIGPMLSVEKEKIKKGIPLI